MISKDEYRKIFIAILVGAITAFATTFLEGLIDFMRGVENNVTGGLTATAIYFIKNL